MGGMLYGLWPSAASARTCLAARLPKMAGYAEHARQIAAALAGAPAVRVLPDPPQTPMMHLLLAVGEEEFRAAALRLAKAEGLWTWPDPMPTPDPGVQRIELSIGDATCALSPAEVATAIRTLAAG
jgi:hypothetical protein